MRIIKNFNLLCFLLWTGIIIIIFLLYMEGSTKLISLKMQKSNMDYEYIDELLEDHRRAPTDLEIYENIARDLPSSPIDFWRRNEYATLQVNVTCARYPHILELKYHNTYWQTYLNGNLTYYLYAAYYDTRKMAVATPVVRILAMVNQIKYNFPRQYCQIWFDEFKTPVIVPVKQHRDIWEYNWGHDLNNQFYPVLITCELPKAQLELIPQTISLVVKECDKATNNLKVTYEHPPTNATTTKKRKFAVCAKALWFSYTDMSARFVEWLEMMRILGAEKIFIYYLQAHPNITRVLEYYKQQGLVDFPRITLARGEPNFPHFTQMAIKHDEHNHRLNQVLQLNDCLYRNMYNYEYLALIDTDEVIMPLGNLTSWSDIIDAVELTRRTDQCYACHCFQNVYYPRYPQYVRYTKDIPKYMYMLQHVRRVRKHLRHGLATKCLHNTNYVTTVHNHYPRSTVAGCNYNNVNADVAQMQHYREPDVASDLDDPVIDDNMWRFKETLMKRSLQTYRDLKFYKKINSTDVEKSRKTMDLY